MSFPCDSLAIGPCPSFGQILNIYCYVKLVNTRILHNVVTMVLLDIALFKLDIDELIADYAKIVDIFSSSCRGHHKNPPSESYVLSELVDCVSLDGESLQAALSRQVLNSIQWILVQWILVIPITKQVHEITARLLDIHDKMMLINNKEDIRLILHQSDYMLDSETNSLLQIENSRSYYFAINAATFCCSIRLLLNLPDHACLVVGIAVMLGEIINYVQSLQRQVEVHQSCGPPHFSLETSGAPLSYLCQPHHGSPLGYMDNQSCMHPLDTAFCLVINLQYHFLNGVSDASSQLQLI
ncbi:Glutathione synthetase chloroplastic [Zea mays]|uniref:Glutathione synthetase chloroplastic n=1 Tax=Zea mays TaxID=4577 RepID=A0A1D6P4Y4_MAIZE|nr:Glutathione synthetase chloroplastic [Zea mays]